MQSNPAWYLYVVECSDSTLYTGVTTDVERRVREHNTTSRGAKYTKFRRPVKLLWFKMYSNRSNAQSAEYAFKKLPRQQKVKLIRRYLHEQELTEGEVMNERISSTIIGSQ